MKKFVVRLMACFIPLKKWRKKFRHYFLYVDFGEIVIHNLKHPQNAVHYKPSKTQEAVEPFSIGITTYNKRFDKYFKPLIKQIRRKFKGDIIVCINANHQEEFDQNYRQKMLEFLSDYDRVYPMFFTDFRSLAKLWNNCLINSPTNHLLLLNDDVSIKDEFFTHLPNAIVQNNYQSFKINGSWCFVFLNREEVANVGWFDERFLGIGYEDTDFEARWFIKYKQFFPQIVNIPGIQSYSDDKEVIVNQRKAEKYSLFNSEFFFQKFKIIKKDKPYGFKIKDQTQYPYEQFYWSKKNEL